MRSSKCAGCPDGRGGRRSRHRGELGQTLRTHVAQGHQARHDGGAVHDGQGFFRAEPDGLQAVSLVGMRGGHQLAIAPHLPPSLQGRGHVGQGCQITARTHRPALGDGGRDAAVQQRRHAREHQRPHPRVAARQGGQAHHQHGAASGLVQQGADAAAVVLGQVGRQGPRVLGIDAVDTRGAEPGVDPVGGNALLEAPPHLGGTRFEPGLEGGVFAQRHGRSPVGHVHHLLHAELGC